MIAYLEVKEDEEFNQGNSWKRFSVFSIDAPRPRCLRARNCANTFHALSMYGLADIENRASVGLVKWHANSSIGLRVIDSNDASRKLVNLRVTTLLRFPGCFIMLL